MSSVTTTQPDHRLLDGVLLMFLTVVGSMLVATDFFREYISQPRTAVIIGVIGFLGMVWYFSALVLARPEVVEKWRCIALIVTTIATLAAVTQQSIAARLTSPHQVGDISDSMVQIESAANFLLHGQNPYTADFTHSPNVWRFDPQRDGHYDPARNHYIYPPLSTLLVVPVVWFAHVTHGPVDGRWVTVAALIVLWWVLMSYQKTYAAKARVTLLTLGNPGLYLLAVAGFNDMIVIVALVGGGMLGLRHKWVWSAACVAVAIGTKQTSWLFAALWFPWLWFSASDRQLKMRSILMVVGLSLLVYLPFIAWNASAFFNDTIWYMALALPAIHAITGPTIVPLLAPLTKQIPGLASGIEFIFGLVGLSLAGLMIYRRPTATWWLIGGSLATLLLAMSHQFFYYNYALGILGALIGAYALQIEAQPHA